MRVYQRDRRANKNFQWQYWNHFNNKINNAILGCNPEYKVNIHKFMLI